MKKEHDCYLRFFYSKHEKYLGNQIDEIEYWEELEPYDKVKDKHPWDRSIEEETLILVYEYLEQQIKNIQLEFVKETLDWNLNSFDPQRDIRYPNIMLSIAFVDNQSLNDSYMIERLVKPECKSKDPEACKKEFKLRLMTDPITRRFQEPYTPHPIIFIGLDNLMELQSFELQATQSQSKDDGKEFALENKIQQRIDPRFRIMDSSIWNQYVSLYPPQDFHQRLGGSLQDILIYHHHGLYESIVAREYLEFQCRKLEQSYVKNYAGGHAKKVTPFRFHSENKMKQLADEKLKDIRKKKLKWSCLLVDDYALKNLRPQDESNEDLKITWKRDWILQLVNSGGEPILEFLNDETDGVVKNDNRPRPNNKKEDDCYKGYVNYFIQHLKKLETGEISLDGQSRRPDIIILDYFFGIEEVDPEQQYGHKFIKELKDGRAWYEGAADEEPEILRRGLSPQTTAFGKYWIFPISAFEHAFRSHLRLMGISINDEYIEMGDGADPINSPELFRYLFYCFLENQYKELRIEIDNIAEKLCKGIDDTEIGELKFRLAENYTPFVGMVSKYSKLNKEKELSTFARSYLQEIDRNKQLNSVVTHLQTLVGLIAHGSIWDWPKMWQEYQIIKDLRINASITHPKIADELIPQLLLEKMRKYIIRLKKVST